MTKQVYITTPIYYVNGEPHIGHFYTSLATDILARLYQYNGDKIKVLTGTDEHGQKVQQSAKKLGYTAKEFCDVVSAKFRNLNADFDLIHSQNNFDNGNNFIRTTDEKHIKYVQEVWKRLEENGWIYKGTYAGWYAVRDESFYTENELVDGKAPTGAEVKWQEEECYFFKLSLFQDVLYDIFSTTDIINPKSSRSEIVAFLDNKTPNKQDNKLKDLCVSRAKTSFDWGIDVPTDTKHTVYVWIDALFNYFSALGGDKTKKFEIFWKQAKTIHIIGKEIIRFHSIYWYALIYGLFYKNDGKIDKDKLLEITPKKLFAHGWWVKDGEKMSKSLGNVVNPYEEAEWLQSLGLSKETSIDYLRYFLISAMPFGNDGDYTRKGVVESVNANLVNNLGNLIQRITTMLVKNFSDRISEISFTAEKNDIETELNNFDFTTILNKLFSQATALNQEFDNQAPWKLLKTTEEDKEKAFQILSSFIPRCISLVDLLEPFCPHIALILKQNLLLKQLPVIVCKRISL